MPTLATADKLTVMTRNLFLGAEIQSLAFSPDIPSFLEGVKGVLDQAAANDFTERAVALAVEIVEKKPDLVGLQEVYNFKNYGNNGPSPFRDYLTDLIGALQAQGACYKDVATVTNLDFALPIPVPTYGIVSITDRDVILARCNVDTQVVDLTIDDICPSERVSDDGCTYDQILVANTILGPIPFKRGYIAVDALIGSLPVRFFNTHLEIRYPDPFQPLSSFYQAAQASELIYIINHLPPNVGAPVIVVGDINSSPEDAQIFLWMPPYMQFTSALYLDAWTLRPGKPKGFTCCYDEDLSIPEDLYERVDVIFSSVLPTRVKANVVGNDEADQTNSGLWPSDHAGVVARMTY